MRIREIQEALRADGLDGWLFFDHHRRDPLAYRVLRFEPAQSVSRRWYYLVPAQGEPAKLVHRIEPKVLDPLPGSISYYAGWQQQQFQLQELLKGTKRVAMQYSPRCAVPYVANVDAGTIELVKGAGPEVVSSADLVQYFEARWSEEAYQSHIEAGRKVDAVRAAAFQHIGDCLRAGQPVGEYSVQQLIRTAFEREGLFTDHGPIVGVNANASNPHYEPAAESHSPIREGDLVLIDLWAKLDRPGSVYYDVTWMGYCGTAAPEAMSKVFAVVRGARDAAVERVKSAVAKDEPLAGYMVDDACRAHIRDHGYADYFFHRTGHSIGEEVHGNGANMDNYETHDERKVIPGTCFSVEPGIYLPEFGVRSEVNVYRGEKHAEVTGAIQREIIPLL